MDCADVITEDRIASWKIYYDALLDLEVQGLLELPVIPDSATQNAHMFYIKVADLSQRTELISYLKNRGVFAAFHYVPLHSSPAGVKVSRFSGLDRFTTLESERLIRLPMWYGISENNCTTVAALISDYFRSK